MPTLRNATTKPGRIIRWKPHPDHGRPSTYQVSNRALELFNSVGYRVPNDGDEVEIPEALCRPPRVLGDLYFKNQQGSEEIDLEQDVNRVKYYDNELPEDTELRLREYIETHPRLTDEQEAELSNELDYLATPEGGNSAESISQADLLIRLVEVGMEDVNGEWFRGWYQGTVDGPHIGESLRDSSTARTLGFLAMQDDVSSISLIGVGKANEETNIEASFDLQGDNQIKAEITEISFWTGTGLLPSEDDQTGGWDEEYPIADWFVESVLSAGSENTTRLETSVTLTSAGILTAHTDIFDGSECYEEEFRVRHHQTELVSEILRRHIESPGPFALPAKRGYSEYTSAVDFFNPGD